MIVRGEKMSDSKYYDGTKLLSLLDINGKKPEIYICTSNRTGGKTTYFARLLVNHFLKGNGKFCLLYRFNYELTDCANKFFKVINELFFPDMVMAACNCAKGLYTELYLNNEPCGYAIALNGADKIKTYSHVFSDVKRMMFDEFQSETNHYCPDEVKKFISVHTSVARGNGEQVRYVPVYMLSNPVSLINPYYVELGISDRLRTDTKFLKGDGFVLEQGYNEGAAAAQKESGFNRAFSKNSYVAYSAQAVYLNDRTAFIERVSGKNAYICTLKYKGAYYAVREYPEYGIVYCDNRPDLSYPIRITVTTEDHEINYVMLRNNDFLLSNLRFYFDHGVFRFKNLQCKEAIIKALSY